MIAGPSAPRAGLGAPCRPGISSFFGARRLGPGPVLLTRRAASLSPRAAPECSALAPWASALLDGRPAAGAQLAGAAATAGALYRPGRPFSEVPGPRPGPWFAATEERRGGGLGAGSPSFNAGPDRLNGGMVRLP